ncbi:MAG: NTP transferase domain-containing protein [Maricaulaceae bacterium]|nr:NTP transferase domain-containing protein [Maricaulaceae bacterium]
MARSLPSPARPDALAGLLLAGGRSSRMGRDKALIEWRGETLLDRARRTLCEAGADQVFVLGRPELADGLADVEPGAGPARAVTAAAGALRVRGWVRFLAIPVDMPLMTAPALARLAAQAGSAVYDGWPLPLYLTRITMARLENVHSVKDLAAASGATRLPSPEERLFANVNTPGDLTAL